MANRLALLVLILAVAFPILARAQHQSKSRRGTEIPAGPETVKIWNAFSGDWDNTEVMERSEYFPNGGGRAGVSHWRLAIGGTTLIDEGHSDGTAGPLDHLLLFRWDKWEGDTFVNDSQETVHGKLTKMRDSFIEIIPNSHTLVAAIDSGNGSMKALITTRSVRRKTSSAQ